jgi:hypothetical protein
MTPVNTEQIKRALDSFTDDDYVAAKEILRNEIRSATDNFLQNKLGLKDITPEDNNDPEEENEEE